MVVPYSVGQVQILINGVEVASTRGLSDASSTPTMFQSPPFTTPVVKPSADGSFLIAIRTWGGVPIAHGLVQEVQLGSQDGISDELELSKARTWDQSRFSSIFLSFLFFSVSILGATLYIAQRNHAEYLWLTLLCLSVTFTYVAQLLYGAEVMPFYIFQYFDLWTGRIFMAVTLEFVLRFTASRHRRVVRGVQIAILLSPIVGLMHFERLQSYSSIGVEVLFTVLISILLFSAWRKGRPEAGVMLLPFFLAATADSIDSILDYAAGQHWLDARFTSHRFHLGPVVFGTTSLAYTLFLGSLIAVILYRFIHVSQDEQRSAAEIDAARSVQALLIPTQLPSNKSFILESAYLPANGVGGDFFQALPLKDDSMLIVVGDVSGKGLQAAMNASTLVGALRNELSHDPATVLSHLNHVMLGESAGMVSNSVAGFATCLCARVYPSGKMTIANAGHLSPYRDGRELELAANLPLGIVPAIEYEQADFQLKQGDRLTFISDGVVEAANAKGELFGFERTQQVSHEPARYIAQIAQRFGQTDDITVVSLYFVPAA